ncbi:MAG: hypothetical protein CTY33_00200 [Methylotenera sp.]|nr:MAG: hypothetical protein CTY33_00200 [Methylotenera sp.]
MSITYQSLKLAEKPIREISQEVNLLSKGDFKIALRTAESMMLLFTSEIPDSDIKKRMKGLAYGEVRYLLFSINQIQVGFLDSHVLEWLALRTPRTKIA